MSVFSDLLIVWALGAAVASPRMSAVARPVLATFAFAGAWLLTAAFDAPRAPGLGHFLGVGVVVLSMGMAAITVHASMQQKRSR